MHGHQHVHTAERHGGNFGCLYRSSIRKGSERNEFAQTVFYSQRRISQHVGYIRIAQQIHVSAHGQSIQRTAYGSIQVYKDFTVDHTLLGAGSIEQGVILCTQVQLCRRILHIAEVYIPIYRERIPAGGVYSKLIKYKLIILYLQRTIVEPIASACLTGVDRYAVQ